MEPFNTTQFFIQSAVALLLASFGTVLAYLLAVNRFRKEKSVEYNVAKDNMQLESFVQLWNVARYISKNRDNPEALLTINEGNYLLNKSLAKKFLEEFHICHASYGLFWDRELRGKLFTYRGYIISIVESPEAKESADVKPDFGKKIAALSQEIIIDIRQKAGFTDRGIGDEAEI